MKYIGRPSVLCVESDTSARECLDGALAKYDCVFAINAYEALKALHARPFDAYVLDYWMPDWSGPLLCREIRKHDPHAAVLFCSEAASDVHRGRALRAGASAYLAKPINAQLFTEKLATLVKLALNDGLRAADDAERALGAELNRRGVAAATPDGTAEALARLGSAARSVERTARARAYKAFIESGGTRAQFDRWWAERSRALFVSGEAVA